MVRNDAEITEFVLNNCNSEFPTDFINKLGSNSQSSRLATKYDIIEEAIKQDWKIKDKKYTQKEIDIDTSKAYIYAKMVSGKFLEIRPRVDSKETIDSIIKNYEDGYKYIQEAAFFKLSNNGISSYVKGRLEGNSFFTKIAGVTNSQPSEIKRNLNNNPKEIYKIKNIILQIQARENEKRWLISKIERNSEKYISEKSK